MYLQGLLLFQTSVVTVRKALGYLFSLRAEYINTEMKGQNWKASSSYSKNGAWGSYYSQKRSNAGPVIITNAAGARPASGKSGLRLL